MFLRRNFTFLVLVISFLANIQQISFVYAMEPGPNVGRHGNSGLFANLYHFIKNPSSALHWAFGPKGSVFVDDPIGSKKEHGIIGSHVANVVKATLQVGAEQFRPGGHGHKVSAHFVNSLAKALKELVEDPEGEGRLAFRKCAQFIQQECQQDGSIYKVIVDMWPMWQEQLKQGGGARKVIDEFLGVLLAHLYEDEGALKKAIERASGIIQEQGIIGLRKWAATGGAEIAALADNLEVKINSVGLETERRLDAIGTTLGGITKDAEVRFKNIQGIGKEIEDNAWSTGLKFAALIVVTVAAVYGVKVLWNQIERNLNTPKLIIESSQKSLWQKMTAIFIRHDDIPEMIFSPDLKKRLDNIIAATKNIREKIANGQKNVKYRNLILWGPPGTGKTMFAKILALSSGMQYVMMSGASFAQFKEGQGITEMNKLFEWANNSKNGLLIFIDEAESFLGGRVGSDVTKESYQILNNFLNHTGTRSDKFMIVVATNHPEFLDPAMPSRIDDAVEIKLPELDERAKILRLYRDTILLDTTQNSRQFVESVKIHFNDEAIDQIAQQTIKFSGRELAGIINAIITDAAVTDSGLASEGLIANVVDLAVKKNHEFSHHLQSVDRMAAAAA